MNALPVPFYGQGHAHLPIHSPEACSTNPPGESSPRRSPVSLWENPAENAMEGGSVFPEISQE
jgi:hypothetical protein